MGKGGRSPANAPGAVVPQARGPSRTRRLVHKADFESLMAAPMWSRSAHFALHLLDKRPAARGKAVPDTSSAEISTEVDNILDDPVDISSDLVWFGVVVPKRHARRAVTRNLLKRQVREAFARHGAALAPGMWLVRLRRAFAPADFPAARSSALAGAARLELDMLLQAVPAGSASSASSAGRASTTRRRSRAAPTEVRS